MCIGTYITYHGSSRGSTPRRCTALVLCWLIVFIKTMFHWRHFRRWSQRPQLLFLLLLVWKSIFEIFLYIWHLYLAQNYRTRHFNLLLITNRSWILAIDNDRIFWKNLLENKEMVFKNGVYDGALTVSDKKCALLFKRFHLFAGCMWKNKHQWFRNWPCICKRPYPIWSFDVLLSFVWFPNFCPKIAQKTTLKNHICNSFMGSFLEFIFSNSFSQNFAYFIFFTWSKVGRIVKSVRSAIYRLFRTCIKKIEQKTK